MAKNAKHKPVAISYTTLLERLADPDYPKEDILPYLETEEDGRIGMAPILVPNEDLVLYDDLQSVHERARGDIGLGFLNSVYSRRRWRRFQRNLRKGDKRLVLLAEGDSWFQFPVFLEDVIDYLKVKYNILCLSAAGDELREMVKGAEYWDYLEYLRSNNIQVAALLLSGGGNDIVGDELAELLLNFKPGSKAKDLLNQVAVSDKFGQIAKDYRAIFDKVRSRFPDLPIIIHGYDYAIPRPDQGFKIPPLDGWLGEPMREKRNITDGKLQAEIVRLLIDRFNSVLADFAEGPPNGVPGVHYVDNRNVLDNPKLWHDELHPTDKGFKLVADKFSGALADLGL